MAIIIVIHTPEDLHSRLRLWFSFTASQSPTLRPSPARDKYITIISVIMIDIKYIITLVIITIVILTIVLTIIILIILIRSTSC